MTKLMTGVSAIALAAMLALPAAAQVADAGNLGGGNNTGVVDGNNWYWSWGALTGDNSDNSSTINQGTANDARGVIQVNQNSGANSGLQNATALAYIEANVFVFQPFANAWNNGAVTNNYSNRDNGSTNSSTIDGSFQNTRGVVNVNQNSGDNSLLQNATSIAALIDCLCEYGAGAYGAQTAPADATNAGGKAPALVAGNWARQDDRSSSSSTISGGSFNGAEGVTQVNQNSGANSLLQNATAVAYVSTRIWEDHAVANATNSGTVGHNGSDRDDDSNNSSSITGSFQGVRGATNVNQNSGNNSLLQNATAIAALIDCVCGPEGAHPLEALATASNGGTVGGNGAWADDGSDSNTRIDGSFGRASGIVQVNQNAGANSALQNSTALAYIHSRISGDLAVATAVNGGTVVGNYSSRSDSSDTSATIVSSFGDVRGAINVNQNSGDNSLLQNATAIAALINCGCEPTGNRTLEDEAIATALNRGQVVGSGNHAYTWGSNADASISGSFNDAQGVIQVNQNAGANSLLQNATAVASIDGKLGDQGGANDVANSVATAVNNGLVQDNSSYRVAASNDAAIAGSFNSTQGVVNVNQNVGDNSLLQNAAAIASLIDCNCVTNHDPAQDIEEVSVIAQAVNDGRVIGNDAQTYAYYHVGSNSGASISDSFNRTQGVVQVNQNAGANSALQNSAAIGHIRGRLEDDGSAVATAVAVSTNSGTVTGSGNSSIRVGSANTATISRSFNSSRGVTNANQNAGDNSLLQNAAALAAVQYCGPNCLSADTKNLQAIAAATNYGTVRGNNAAASHSSASATISGSFQSYQGLANVNQNAGANSLLQNSVSVGAIFPGSSSNVPAPVAPVAPVAPINPIR